MGWRTIETIKDLDGALRAWAHWKETAADVGYPSMDTIARVKFAPGGGVFGSRVPKGIDMPWGVELCVQSMEAMRATSIGRFNVAALHCHYLLNRVPESQRIGWLSDWMAENGMLEASGQAILGRHQYFERVARAKEMLMDVIERKNCAA